MPISNAPLKRCSTSVVAVENEISSSLDGEYMDVTKLRCSPLKRCSTSVVAVENEISTSLDGEYMDVTKLSCPPLKRCCTSVVAVENEISTSLDGEYMDVTKLTCPVVDMRLAVIPFLSNFGKTNSLVRCSTAAQPEPEPVGFDVVLRKHLLICCVSLPLSAAAYYFHAMMEAYSDLPRDKFEIVLVATTDSTKPAFDAFVSQLPPILAIPFADSDTRHFICSFIGSGFRHIFCPLLSAILINPQETVSHYFVAPDRFLFYGSEWFPFRETDADAIVDQDAVLMFRLDPLYKKGLQFLGDPRALNLMRDPLIQEPLSLHNDILLCEPSLAIPRIGSVGGGPQESLTVLELSKKHLGLYLCLEQADGFLRDLIRLHKKCIKRKLELEILVVCIPLVDPENTFPEKLIEILRGRNITSWFVFPKHYKLRWRRLWRVFGRSLMEDRLIILRPDGKPGELEGRGVIEQLGVKAYPFTRSTLLERRFAFLRSLTFASLFKGRACLKRKGKKDKVVRQSYLRGKKLLVYLDWLQLTDDRGILCRRLMKLYPVIKSMGWEVVFVPLDKTHKEPDALYGEMPWPIMPVQRSGVINKLIFEGEGRYGNQVIAFSKDGKIVSIEVTKDLMKEKKVKLSGAMFRDNLYEEIAYNFTCFRG